MPSLPTILFFQRYRKMRKDKLHSASRGWIVPLLFLLPHLFFFSCFILFPTLAGIFAAFTHWPLAGVPEWIGLENFKTVFLDQSSQYYWQLRWGLANTVKFVILCVPFRVIVPLILAWGISTKCKGNKLSQALFYLPALLSLSVVMVSWNYMFHTTYGVINAVLGLGKLKWVSTDPYNWIALVIITVWWGCGGNLVIYQSALASVPAEMIEAAHVDGANAFQTFFRVTLPSIKFPLQYTIITSMIGEFQIWGQPAMFNKGGITLEVVNGVAHPANKMLLQYIMENGFGNFGVNAGVASVMSLVLGGIMFVISLLQFRAMREKGA